MSLKKEAQARIKINKLLEDAGWRFFDDERGVANIQLEPGVKLTKQKLDTLGENFETETRGYVDYLLLDENKYPIVVVEAKKENIHPLDAKEQARDYAYSQRCRFVILSNGNAHYFWDTETGNPTIITEFPTLESLQHRATFKPDTQALADEHVDEGYLARIRDAEYDKDERFQNEATRADYVRDNKLVVLRKFQLYAIHALQKAAQEGNDRYLFEMATGTGKTLTTAAICRLFLRTGNAKRILFLVDRIELETQAEKALKGVLGSDYIIKTFKTNRDNWNQAQIVVSTVQSLLAGDKYRHEFSPTDFELVISDEAHRSLGGNSRAVFEYFNGYKLGLTATPKDYLKNIDKQVVRENDPRAFERRELLDTYKTFGCESGMPTYRYSLLDGVHDGFLVNPHTIDARTEVTTKLLSEEGYAVFVTDEEGKEGEENFTHRDYERKFFNDETNIAFCKAFIENARKDPISGEVGKSLVFCVSQTHARKITEILNLMAHKVWEGSYNSDFAVQVTSNVKDAQEKTQQYANNSLNGFSRFKEDYKTSKTRVCVTVGMMTTGYDCSDILNICLMRPIFSPSDFVQMKGRGTRLHTFVSEEQQIKKDGFLLFDFFANCEYFEEKFDYDEELQIPKMKGDNAGEGGEGPINLEIDIAKADQIVSQKETVIGEEGMRIDRELYFKKFEEKVMSNKEACEIYEKEGIDGVVEFVKQEILDRPSEYFTPDQLRKNLTVDRWVSFKEMLRKVFGEIDHFKSREEKTEDEFDKFQDIEKLDADIVPSAKIFFSSYLQDDELRKIIDSKEYGRLNTMPGIDMRAFKTLAGYKRGGEVPYTQYIPSYIRDYVANLKEFEKV
ncbi:MAG: DEAD/DEAH box helicase family protein [Candidatus Pacebacteria bacterium]|nr:DEAD/DEAH box helicase family protein [Candidatus Paceibacterota bacterium]